MLINRARSIYQYSSMAPRLSGKNCKFFKFLLSSNSQERLRYKENNTKYRSLTRKPRSHVRILIYRTWPIHFSHFITELKHGAILYNQAEVFSLSITNPNGRPMLQFDWLTHSGLILASCHRILFLCRISAVEK